MSSPPIRQRVLLVAYACNPYQGSEEGVGWSWVEAITAHHDVDLITAAFHRDAIEDRLRVLPCASSVRVHCVASRWWHYRPGGTWKRIEASPLKPLMNVSYSAWQRDAFALAGRLHDANPFDLVHLLTYVGFRFPGRFHELDAPFVWGPIGGLENTPARLLPLMGFQGATYYAVRNALNTVQKAVLPGPKRAMRRAAGGLIAATRGTQREIRRSYGQAAKVISEIGVPARPSASPSEREAGAPLRLAWSGQLVPGKALNLLLDAVASLPPGCRWHLDVLGDGPRRPAWQRMRASLGISEAVTFHGWLPHDEALRIMGDAHLLVITSLKDLTSTVVLEALSLGVPVLCLDHCGFADVVTRHCGIKVAPTTRKAIVTGLADGIRTLESDEPRRRELARGGLRRAEDFTFDKKMSALDGIYRRKSGERDPASRVATARRPRCERAVRLLGSEVDLVSRDEAVDVVERWIEARDGRCRQVVVTGFHGLWEGMRDEAFRDVLRAGDLWVPDGIAPVWAARVRGHRHAVRVPGAELMEGLLDRGNERGWRSFFYGDTEETLGALKRSVESRWPGHLVVGTLSPPFRALTQEEETSHLEVIRRAHPDVIWVGLGLPRQERWIHRMRAELDVPVAIGVGAAFRFLAGTVERSPEWMGRAGLEWAWRLFRDPRRTWRRCFLDGPRFIGAVLLETVGITHYDYDYGSADRRRAAPRIGRES